VRGPARHSGCLKARTIPLCQLRDGIVVVVLILVLLLLVLNVLDLVTAKQTERQHGSPVQGGRRLLLRPRALTSSLGIVEDKTAASFEFR